MTTGSFSCLHRAGTRAFWSSAPSSMLAAPWLVSVLLQASGDISRKGLGEALGETSGFEEVQAEAPEGTHLAPGHLPLSPVP